MAARTDEPKHEKRPRMSITSTIRMSDTGASVALFGLEIADIIVPIAPKSAEKIKGRCQMFYTSEDLDVFPVWDYIDYDAMKLLEDEYGFRFMDMVERETGKKVFSAIPPVTPENDIFFAAIRAELHVWSGDGLCIFRDKTIICLLKKSETMTLTIELRRLPRKHLQSCFRRRDQALLGSPTLDWKAHSTVVHRYNVSGTSLESLLRVGHLDDNHTLFMQGKYKHMLRFPVNDLASPLECLHSCSSDETAAGAVVYRTKACSSFVQKDAALPTSRDIATFLLDLPDDEYGDDDGTCCWPWREVNAAGVVTFKFQHEQDLAEIMTNVLPRMTCGPNDVTTTVSRSLTGGIDESLVRAACETAEAVERQAETDAAVIDRVDGLQETAAERKPTGVQSPVLATEAAPAATSVADSSTRQLHDPRSDPMQLVTLRSRQRVQQWFNAELSPTLPLASPHPRLQQSSCGPSPTFPQLAGDARVFIEGSQLLHQPQSDVQPVATVEDDVQPVAAVEDDVQSSIEIASMQWSDDFKTQLQLPTKQSTRPPPKKKVRKDAAAFSAAKAAPLTVSTGEMTTPVVVVEHLDSTASARYLLCDEEPICVVEDAATSIRNLKKDDDAVWIQGRQPEPGGETIAAMELINRRPREAAAARMLRRSTSQEDPPENALKFFTQSTTRAVPIAPAAKTIAASRPSDAFLKRAQTGRSEKTREPDNPLDMPHPKPVTPNALAGSKPSPPKSSSHHELPERPFRDHKVDGDQTLHGKRTSIAQTVFAASLPTQLTYPKADQQPPHHLAVELRGIIGGGRNPAALRATKPEDPSSKLGTGAEGDGYRQTATPHGYRQTAAPRRSAAVDMPLPQPPAKLQPTNQHSNRKPLQVLSSAVQKKPLVVHSLPAIPPKSEFVPPPLSPLFPLSVTFSTVAASRVPQSASLSIAAPANTQTEVTRRTTSSSSVIPPPEPAASSRSADAPQKEAKQTANHPKIELWIGDAAGRMPFQKPTGAIDSSATSHRSLNLNSDACRPRRILHSPLLGQAVVTPRPLSSSSSLRSLFADQSAPPSLHCGPFVALHTSDAPPNRPTVSHILATFDDDHDDGTFNLFTSSTSMHDKSSVPSRGAPKVASPDDDHDAWLEVRHLLSKYMRTHSKAETNRLVKEVEDALRGEGSPQRNAAARRKGKSVTFCEAPSLVARAGLGATLATSAFPRPVQSILRRPLYD